MNSQGLFGALHQYWSVEPKARLHRRNSYFNDHPNVSNYDALRFGVVLSSVATAILILWSILGVII